VNHTSMPSNIFPSLPGSGVLFAALPTIRDQEEYHFQALWIQSRTENRIKIVYSYSSVGVKGTPSFRGTI
jgi:hypothetical protein